MSFSRVYGADRHDVLVHPDVAHAIHGLEDFLSVERKRVPKLPDGRVVYRLKRPCRGCTTDVIFEARDFVAKLAALVRRLAFT